MRTTHKLTLTSARAIWAASALFVLAGLVFAFAPMRPVAAARQALAARVNASPTAERILSLAPVSMRRAIKQAALAQPKAANVAVGTSANMMFAPVTITKDSVPPTGSAVAQGQTIVYNIQATQGPSSDITASGGFIRIDDTAPTGTLFTTVTVQQQPQFGGAWSCTLLGGGTSFRCSAGDDAGGGIDTFTTQEFVRIRAEAVVQPATPIGTTLTNTATYTFESTGTGQAEGTATSNATVHTIASADVSIAKVTSNPAPVAGGAAFSYTITVTNPGPGNASNVVVTDPLPQDVNFVSVSATGGFSCTSVPVGTSGIVSCSNANFAPGTATITIVAQVASATAGGGRTNTATVTSTTPDPNPANNTASAPQTIANDAGLTITKTSQSATACAGDTITYNIAVTKTGDSSALGVTVTDPIPANATFVSVTGSQDFTGTCSFNPAGNGTVTCIAPVLSMTSNILLTIRTSPNTPPGPLTNTATLTAGTGTVTGPNPAVATTTIQRCNDLGIDKSAPSTGIAGGLIDYTIKLTNNGPSTVFGGAAGGTVIVMDTLPAGVTPVAVPLVVGANLVITPVGSATCTYDAVTNKVTCMNTASPGGDIPVGGMITIIFKVRVAASFPQNTNLVNCAMVTVAGTGVVDNNAGNNNDCATTVITGSADLAVSKSAIPVVDPDGAGPLAPVALPIVGPNVPPGSVNAGGYIQYTVPFGNNGTSDAINVILNDVIPGNTAFVGALATGGVFVPAAQPPAVPFTFTIQATDTVAPLGGPISLTCTVVGAPGSQTIYCRPQGNTAVTNPTPPPATIAYADGTLPAGYSGTLTFFVRVNESVAGGTIVANPANIASGLCAANGPAPGLGPVPPIVTCASTPDPNAANNTSLPTSTVVIASSNLTISKIVQSAVTSASNPVQTGPIGPATAPNGAGVTGTAVLPGTLLTYRITLTNTGPSDVSNIRLTDVLPSSLETPPGRVLGARFVSATPVLPSGATFTCAAPVGINPGNNPQSNGGSIVCTAPLLSANAPNNVAAIDITVFIDPATKASLIDTATFDATLNNFNRPVSGSTTLTTPVAATSDLALTKTHTNAAGVVGGPITAGTVFTYTVTLTNNGPSAAQMVSLVDTLPLFQQVRSIQVLQTPDVNGAPNLTCTATPAIGAPTTTGNNTTSVTCTAAELPPNKNANGTVNPSGTLTVILTVRQDELTTQPLPVNYQNCVSVTSMSTDPVAANSTNVCDPLTLIFFSPLTGTKIDTPDPVIAGNLLTYTITGTPSGPSAALNFTIQDALPVGTVFIAAVASPGATLTTPAVGANGTVTAIFNAAGGTPGGLTPPGTVRTLTIVVRVCPDFQQILNLTDAQMCVPNLTNTANIFSDTPPNLTNIPTPATSITTVQAQSDLSITKSGPGQIIYSTTNNPSNITYTITFANAGPSNANGVTITDILPKGFVPVAGGLTSTVPGTTFTTATTGGTTTVVANLGVLGAANQCQLTRPTSGTLTIVARVPIKNPSISVTNQATIASTNCLPETGTLPLLTNLNSGLPAVVTPGTLMLANNVAFASTNIVPPGTTPGNAYPALSEVSDQKEGSILFYPIYTSDAVNSNTQNTRIAITNTSNTERVTVHLFAVDGASCAVLDAFICLTANQTTVFLASDFDPGNTGYLVAVAVEDATGLPRAFNELIGDEYVKFSTGHAANLGAEAIAATMLFPTGVDANVTTTTLRFDGMNYNRLPRVLAADNIPSPADGNSTMLIIDRVGGDFTTTGANIGNITGLLYDDSEQQFSFTANLGFCQYRAILSNTFPRTFTQFSRILPAGRSGWMKFYSVNDWALFGAQINFNASATTSANAFNQGHNLHKLTLTNAATITVPVFIPNCF